MQMNDVKLCRRGISATRAPPTFVLITSPTYIMMWRVTASCWRVRSIVVQQYRRATQSLVRLPAHSSPSCRRARRRPQSGYDSVSSQFAAPVFDGRQRVDIALFSLELSQRANPAHEWLAARHINTGFVQLPPPRRMCWFSWDLSVYLPAQSIVIFVTFCDTCCSRFLVLIALIVYFFLHYCTIQSCNCT